MIALGIPIDWSILSAATAYYAALGYHAIEVPWIVPRTTSEMTMPMGCEPITTPQGDLIGSAEQGLLQLALTKGLTAGLYMATSPCFRNDVVDAIHGKHFMKVELMILKPEVSFEDRDRLVRDASGFLSQHASIDVIDVGDGQRDIVCRNTGIELGSYGVRSAQGIHWAYGTGVAEPRLSTVLGRR